MLYLIKRALGLETKSCGLWGLRTYLGLAMCTGGFTTWWVAVAHYPQPRPLAVVSLNPEGMTLTAMGERLLQY